MEISKQLIDQGIKKLRSLDEDYDFWFVWGMNFLFLLHFG